MGQETLNQSFEPKSLQLRLPHFITDTHTHSFPFTWVLLMDLGLGSADNINGSRLTEVPLHWTVCLCVYAHTQLFFFFLKSSSRQSHKICKTGRCDLSSLHILLSVSLSGSQVGRSNLKMRCSRFSCKLSFQGQPLCWPFSHTYLHTKTVLISPYPLLSQFQTANTSASGTTDCSWTTDIKVKQPISNYQAFHSFSDTRTLGILN